MTNFQPTQGPGLGAQYAEVNIRCTTTGSLANGCVFLRTDVSPPYSQAIAPANGEMQSSGLLGMVPSAANGEQLAVVIGRPMAILGSNSVVLGSPLAAAATGALALATLGDRVIARSLGAGDIGDVVMVEFNGDTGFGSYQAP